MPTITSIPLTDGIVGIEYSYDIETVPECYLQDENDDYILSGASQYISTTPCNLNPTSRTISIDSAPAWLSLVDINTTAGTATLVGTPPDDGIYQVVLRVVDNTGYSDTQTFDIEVELEYQSLVPDSTWDVWRRASVAPLYLLIIYGHDQTYYLATGKYASFPSDTPPNQPFEPILLNYPYFEKGSPEPFSFSNKGWGSASIANLDYSNDWLTAKLSSVEVEWYVGEEDWPLADFKQIGSAMTAPAGILLEGGNYELPMGDPFAALDVPFYNAGGLPESSYRITNGGPSDGEVIPIALGECFNIKPKLYSLSPLCYIFNRGPSKLVKSVRDNGYELSTNMWHVDLGQSLLYLHFQPKGEITMDISGYITPDGRYLNLIGDMTIFCLHTGPYAGRQIFGTFDINALYPYPAQLYIDDDSTTVKESLEAVIRSIGMFVGIRRDGELYVRPFGFRESVDHVLDAQYIPENSVSIGRRIIPLKSVKTGYRKNNTQQSTFLGYVQEIEPENVKLYEEEYSYVTASNNVDAHYPSAQTFEQETLLVDESDAQAMRNRIAGLYDSLIDEISFPFLNNPILNTVDVGDMISVPWLYKYGINTAKMLVVAKRGNELIVWRKY